MDTKIDPTIYELLIIGAGPAGIALAAEGIAAGIDPKQILILEKHSSAIATIKQYYPEKKMTTVNYKGYGTHSEGILTITDMTKPETIEYFNKVIEDYSIQVHYGEEVCTMYQEVDKGKSIFSIKTLTDVYRSRVLAIAIGILGRPNRPKEYSLPVSLKNRLLFDITSKTIRDEDVLVVGGGDTAAEYVQELVSSGNRVTMSYRQVEFKRLSEINYKRLMDIEQSGRVKILLGSNISGIENDNGRPKVFFKEEQYPAHTYDRVVYALGGTAPVNFLRMLKIEFDEDGPKHDECGETNIENLFLVGDLVVSKTGGSIITAFNSSSRAMKRILKKSA
jgi:thioredoxin reductase (NADPH)